MHCTHVWTAMSDLASTMNEGRKRWTDAESTWMPITTSASLGCFPQSHCSLQPHPESLSWGLTCEVTFSLPPGYTSENTSTWHGQKKAPRLFSCLPFPYSPVCLPNDTSAPCLNYSWPLTKCYIQISWNVPQSNLIICLGYKTELSKLVPWFTGAYPS